MPAPEKWLTEEEIQERFNQARYYERFLDDDDESVHLGEIQDVGPPPRDKRKLGAHIRSQTVTYLNQFDDTIVIVHQHGHRTTGIPAEGTLPDPRFIYEGGVRYKRLPKGAVVPPDQ